LAFRSSKRSQLIPREDTRSGARRNGGRTRGDLTAAFGPHGRDRIEVRNGDRERSERRRPNARQRTCKAGVSRRTLFRMLGPGGNPTLANIARVVKAIANEAA
jgi:hypothetical protein